MITRSTRTMGYQKSACFLFAKVSVKSEQTLNNDGNCGLLHKNYTSTAVGFYATR